MIFCLLKFFIIHFIMFAVAEIKTSVKFVHIFFANDVDVCSCFDYKFTFKRSHFDYTQVFYLLDCIERNVFNFNIYYIVSDFNYSFRGYFNENFGVFYFLNLPTNHLCCI